MIHVSNRYELYKQFSRSCVGFVYKVIKEQANASSAGYY